MVQTHIMNVLPRRLIAQCWTNQETRISLSHFLRASTTPVAVSSSFLCSELPIRYSHILRLLSSLNTDCLQTPLIRNVAQRYLVDICSILHPSLRQTPPRAFSQTIHRLRQRQASSLIRLRYALASSTSTPRSLKLLDHINAVGLGIHFLLDQHVSWHLQTGNHAQALCPLELARQAVNDARQVCGATFDAVPEVEVKAGQADSVTHVPSIIHRMLYESILLTLHSQCVQQLGMKRRWWFERRPAPLVLDVFGGATSIGYRLTNPTACISSPLGHTIPRDPMGLPVRQNTNDDEVEWSVWSGWRMAQTLASHFGGNLDVVSADGLGSTVYLALDRDSNLLERYPVLPAVRNPDAQLDAFLYAVAEDATHHYKTTPATHHHAVSLTAAVGHA
ncbi:hypothetical protein [Absidia glauca]|uniref:Protein-serine/threonine kinase n=1 Tax=Absidia glauca TaxID=4829 RepID=A0A163LQF9_ABSGL|nr:hypothetical protein [Absidia glauca]